MVSDGGRVRMEFREYPDLPGIRSVLVDADDRLWCAAKETYAVSLIHRGRSEAWSPRGGVETGPGTILFNEPASVHKDLRREGPARFQIVNFDPELVQGHAERSGGAFRTRALEQRHPDRPALFALHRVYREQPDMLIRQVIVAEALDALVRQLDRKRGRPRASVPRARLRRAADYIHAYLGRSLTLAELATAAGMDRFHLCRAFREAYGLPPYAYAYALRARIARARVLLAKGTPVIVVANALGFCDQSQLTRHFRRLTGLTPGVFASAVRLGRAPVEPSG